MTGAEPVGVDERLDAELRDGEGTVLGGGTIAMLLALPFALAVDLAAMVVLRRGLGLGRGAAIAAGVAVTVVAWVLIGRSVQAVARRRRVAGGGAEAQHR